MIGLRAHAVALFAGAVCVWGHGITWAQPPSALVLETSGPGIPGVRPYDEILGDANISLPVGARLVFLHYHTCRTVTVVGGRIRFDAETYAIVGGTKESDARTPCPRTVTVKPGGEMAGALIRSLGSAGLSTSSRPTFVVAGPRAEDFASVRVSRGDTIVLEAPLEGRRFRWPSTAEPLAAGPEYELVFIPTIAGAVPVRLKLMIPPSPVEPASETLTVIRLQ